MIDGVKRAEVLRFSFFFHPPFTFDSNWGGSEGRGGSEASPGSLPHTNAQTRRKKKKERMSGQRK